MLRTYPYLKLLGKNPKMICGFEGRENGVRAAAGTGGGAATCGGRSGQRQGARGDGCPARRPSGSAAAAAAAAPLGLTAGPEAQRSGGGDGGGGGLTTLPRGPVPSNRHRPRCGSAGGAEAAAARAALWYPRWVPVNAPFSLLLSISPGG